jgi:hypothetical protein
MASQKVKDRLRKLRQKFGLGEFRKSFKAKTVKIKRKRTSRGVQMAKKRSSRKGSSFGGNKLMNGFIQPKGIIAKALLGVAVSELNDSFAPQMIPMQGVLLAGLVGGLPAAGAAYGVNTLQGKVTKANASAMGTYGNY